MGLKVSGYSKRGVAADRFHVQDALTIASALLHSTKFIERPQPLLCRRLSMPFYLGHAPFLPLRILGETGRARLHFYRGRVWGLVRFSAGPRKEGHEPFGVRLRCWGYADV